MCATVRVRVCAYACVCVKSGCVSSCVCVSQLLSPERWLCLQANEAGNIKKLNDLFVKFTIPVEVAKKQGKKTLEKPSLDGPTAAAIISVAEDLIEGISFRKGSKTQEEIDGAEEWERRNIQLWQQWRWIAKAMAVVDPKEITRDQRDNFGKECRRFGLYWRDAFTSDYMKSFYLHTLLMHGAECWEWVVVKNGLSLGMLSTSAMELRHLVFGRPAHRRTMRGGGGGKKAHHQGNGGVSSSKNIHLTNRNEQG